MDQTIDQAFNEWISYLYEKAYRETTENTTLFVPVHRIKKLEYSKIQSISQHDKRKDGKISISGIVFFVNVQYFDDRRRLRLWIR